ncbi:MAG: histidine kinase, partial [Bacteroidota bacterium]
RRVGIPITTFMLTQDPALVDFIETFTRTNRGRAYYAGADRLVELEWIETKGREARYPQLEPGEYTFQVQAVGHDGLQSSVLERSIQILEPFWRKRWFLPLVVALALGLLFGVAYLRIRNRQRVRQKQMEWDRRIEELEYKAMRAQMNPHFIFNVLTAVQELVATGENAQADQALTSFSRMLRDVLDGTEKERISVREEMAFLGHYLKLEALLFPEKFEFEIMMRNPELANRTLPPLLIQPIVENAVRHGVRPLVGKGRIEVVFEEMEEVLCCVVRDNGVGRAWHAARRNRVPVRYQSRGMALTRSRLELLKAPDGRIAAMMTTDLYDDDEQPAGTEIRLQIPFDWSKNERES